MLDAAILDRFFQPILNRTWWFPQSVAAFWAIGSIAMCCFAAYVVWMGGKYALWIILFSMQTVCIPAILLLFRGVPDPGKHNDRRETLSFFRMIIVGFIVGNLVGYMTHQFSYWVFIPELLTNVFLWFAFCFGSCQTPPALLAKERLANTKV